MKSLSLQALWVGMVGLLCVTAVLCSADSGLARHKKMYIVPAPGKVTMDGK